MVCGTSSGSSPGRLPAILLVAHYDTTAVPGYLGANNSATGVGAVIAIAKALRSDPREPGNSPSASCSPTARRRRPASPDFYAEGLRGSKAYASAHAKELREAIVLDFIALHDELLIRDRPRTAQLWSRLRAAAVRRGRARSSPTGSRAP